MQLRDLTISLLLLAFSVPGKGQLPLRYRIDCPIPGAHYASSIAVLGDLNGDGCDDFACGSSEANYTMTATGIIGGIVNVHSGLDGAVLYAYDGQLASEWIGSKVAGLGDVNGDLVPDFAMSVSPTGIRIHSGANGTAIQSLPGTGLLGAVGDVDADGITDILALASNPSAVVVLSGLNGSVIHSLLPPCQPPVPPAYLCNTGGWGQYAVCTVGDINADGHDDFVISAPTYYDPAMPSLYGRVYLYSGATGSTLMILSGSSFPTPAGIVGTHLGESATGLGDVDGDGHDDFALGEPNASPSGAVQIFSGASGQLLKTIHYPGTITSGQNHGFGRVIGNAGDTNGDGVPDIVIGAYLEQTAAGYRGSVRVFSGFDASILLTRFGDNADARMGVAVAGNGDFDGDGIKDVVASAFFADYGGTNSGSVYVLSVGGVRRYEPTGGLVPGIDLSWQLGQGTDPALGVVTATSAVPFSPGVVALSLGIADSTIGGVPLLIDPSPSQLFALNPITFDSNGSYTSLVGIRHPAIAGINVRAQVFTVSMPYASSNGLEFRLLR